jgi:hypothetical protein
MVPETVDMAVDRRWQRRCPESSTTMIPRLVAAARIAFPGGSRNDLRIGRNKRSAMGFPPLPKGAPYSERAFSWSPSVQAMRPNGLDDGRPDGIGIGHHDDQTTG